MNTSIIKTLFEFLKNMWIVIAVIVTIPPVLWIIIDWPVAFIITKVKGNKSE